MKKIILIIATIIISSNAFSLKLYNSFHLGFSNYSKLDFDLESMNKSTPYNINLEPFEPFVYGFLIRGEVVNSIWAQLQFKHRVKQKLADIDLADGNFNKYTTKLTNYTIALDAIYSLKHQGGDFMFGGGLGLSINNIDNIKGENQTENKQISIGDYTNTQELYHVLLGYKIRYKEQIDLELLFDYNWLGYVETDKTISEISQPSTQKTLDSNPKSKDKLRALDITLGFVIPLTL
ncbi:MAG: hypothetical protein CMP11_07815 [Zetaproteobacteria bacterium]|nr:hypothetical protein [Pseudobdellovibrionaceae bacterium]|tara:strand:+ start:1263 stop:1967 length:705 start_codon:yes stop_codon:yes gene_type:complete